MNVLPRIKRWSIVVAQIFSHIAKQYPIVVLRAVAIVSRAGASMAKMSFNFRNLSAC